MRSGILICIYLVASFGFISCSKTVDLPVKENGAKQYEKELEEIRKGMKGDLKIKLRKNVKGDYGWEITGKDVQEVLKTNDIMKKRLDE